MVYAVANGAAPTRARRSPHAASMNDALILLLVAAIASKYGTRLPACIAGLDSNIDPLSRLRAMNDALILLFVAAIASKYGVENPLTPRGLYE